jgi:site-specific recombinase XerD
MAQQDIKLMQAVNSAVNYLKGGGYAENTILKSSNCWNTLLRYMESKNYSEYKSTVGQDFLKEQYHICDGFLLTSYQKTRIRTINILEAVLFEKPLEFNNKDKAYVPVLYLDIDCAYRKHLTDTTFKSVKTKTSRIRILFRYLEEQKITCIGDITATVILGFMSNIRLTHTSVGSANILYTLRDFLKYCISLNLLPENLLKLVNGIYVNSHEKLPSCYNRDEIERVLSSVDRMTAQGKKEYAIILLAARLGIRASDILGLVLDNIKWKVNRIEFCQKKTGNFIGLPLTEELKLVLLDYLKNSRPSSEYSQLFLRSKVPVIPYTETSVVFATVNKYMVKSGVSTVNKRHGPHSLRHSLASGLLGDKTPLPVISAVLGHESTRHTAEYLRIDIEQLRSVALEVPV